jgi:hypothetical protein
VKNRNIKVAGLSCGLALLLGAGAAPADPIATITTPSGTTQTTFTGSDTLNEVIDNLLPTLALGQINPTTGYQGLGSSQGQRQMEGTPATGEPTCTPTKTEGQAASINPGCQEIAPMSRDLDNKICDDDFLAPNTANVSAQEIAIARDGIVVVTDNASYRQYGDSSTACTNASGAADSNNGDPYVVNAAYSGTGKLRSGGTITLEDGTSYTVGANSLGWKDVLRLVYTGCDNTQGNCASVPRMTRCTSVARKTVIDRWDYMVESGAVTGDSEVSCANAGACADNAAHDGGVRAAYRRDDTSGTTGVFLSLIGLANDTTANLTGRKTLVGIAGWTAISSTHMYCDGGQLEDFIFDADPTLDSTLANFPKLRTAAAPTVNVQGDPVTKPCKAEDVLCGYDKRIGVVRPIRSGEGTNIYPPFQCTKSLFDSIQWINTSKRVCPDGSVPSAGQCELPYFLDTTVTPNVKHYNCVANLDTKPSDIPTAYDGRAYNWVMKNDTTGAPEFITAGILPQVAQWRQHMATLQTTGLKIGGLIPAANLICEEVDATRNIGCIIGKTTCAVGWAGREMAATDPYDNLQEAFRITNLSGTVTAPSDTGLTTTDPTQAYPFARSLFINAIGGFGNITADCTARGGSAAYCADEVTIVNALLNQSAGTQTIIRNAGFIPNVTGVCVNPPASVGCGSTAASPNCTPH